MRKCLILLVLVAASLVSAIPLDEYTRRALTNAGIPTLKTAITVRAAEIQAEKEAVLLLRQEANATCVGIFAETRPSCISCVKSKCEARAEDVCSSVIGDFVNFWTDDFVDFWADDFADFWADDFVDLWVDDFAGFFADDVADFFTDDFVGAFEGFGDSFVSGFEDVGNELGGAFEDIGDFLGDAVDDVGDFVVDDVGGWFANDFVDAFDDVGDFFSDIFGKKKRSLKKRFADAYLEAKLERKRRASEPSCNDLKNNGPTVCMKYYTDECASCAFNRDADCPDYADAQSQARDVYAAGAWLTAFRESRANGYTITSVEYDYANINRATGGFSNAQITVNFFGKPLSFTLADSMVFYNTVVTGPIIAEKALEEYIAGF